MLEEERNMEKAALEAEKDFSSRLQRDREEDIRQGDEVMDTKFKRLEYLLGQSEVCYYNEHRQGTVIKFDFN